MTAFHPASTSTDDSSFPPGATQGSTRWLVRAEGVNFANTLSDTEDLSIIRGASLALLRIDRFVEAAIASIPGATASLLFSGASQCLIEVRLAAPEASFGAYLERAVADLLRRLRQAGTKADPAHPRAGLDEPFEHLSLVVDAEPHFDADDRAPVVARLEARNRSRQQRDWSLPPPGPVSLADAPDNACDPFDRVRPAQVSIDLPKDKVDMSPALVDASTRPDGGQRVRVSASSKARRAFGRTQRKAFYGDELAAEGLDAPFPASVSVTDSLEEIVEKPHPTRRDGSVLPVSLRNKVAVIYADGNAFGKIREHVALDAFSATLTRRRREFLAEILCWYLGELKGPDWSGFATPSLKTGDEPGVEKALRLETLLWGGDEFIFVVPAWLAVPFVERFLAQSAGWEIEDKALAEAGVSGRLTHSLGVVIANAKTPIRLLRTRAQDIADRAKAAGYRDRSTATFEIFESIAPPDVTIAGTRANQYGLGVVPADAREAAQDTVTKALALPGDRFSDLVARIVTLKDGDPAQDLPGFPRSQLYGALRAAQATGSLVTEAADRAVTAHFSEYLDRFGKQKGLTLEALRLPATEADGRGAALDLALLVQLWDYVGLDIGVASDATANEVAA